MLSRQFKPMTFEAILEKLQTYPRYSWECNLNLNEWESIGNISAGLFYRHKTHTKIFVIISRNSNFCEFANIAHS
jgi:hypothetical protein